MKSAIVAALGLSLSLGVPAGATTLAPAGMRAIAVKTGGRLLLASIRGASSSGAVLAAGMRETRGYFVHLSLTSIVRSPDANVLYASFGAVMHGSKVRGVAIAAYSPSGPSGFALLFDRAARFATSGPLLAQQLQATTASGGTRASGSLAAMRHVSAPDGTLSAAIPATWKTPVLANGALVAVAPRKGETVLVNVTFKMIDPRSATYRQEQELHAYHNSGVGQSLYGLPLEYVASPGRALVAMLEAMAAAAHQPNTGARIVREQQETGQPGMLRGGVVITASEGGTAVTSESDVILIPPNQLGAWSLHVIATQAPTDVYASELPTMLAILRGYAYNDTAMKSRAGENIASNEAIGARSRALADRATQNILTHSQREMNQNATQFKASMQNAANAEDGIDRSTARFVHYLGGTTVVENPSNGMRATVDENGARAAAAQDPDHFRIVPVSQYRKGVDF